MAQLYRPLFLLETPMVFTSLPTSELIKYAANGFLATKIAFINEISDLCEECDADIQSVSKAIGLDNRIGTKFLHVGPGYGGSCFPKDTLALAKTAQDFNSPLKIVESVIDANKCRKENMAKRVIAACDGDVQGKTIAILGVTFKPNTDDMRESPSLDIIPALQKAGATIKAFDPAGMKEAEQFFTDITWCANTDETLLDADALVILTEWNEFRALDLAKVKSLLKNPLMIDLRNIYPLEEMEKSEIVYHSIGRATVGGKSATRRNTSKAA